MKCPNVESVVEAFSGDVIDTYPRRGVGGLLTPKSTRLMLENAMQEACQNRCRALLAKNALEDTGAMSMMVDRLSMSAPSGKEYYHKILRAYAETTARQIERWG
ncbi:hypothetical protein AALA98_14640 [Lachnospiraceae bacterium 45-W7]